MKVLKVLTAILGTMIKLAVAVLIILAIYRGTLFAYDYGYRVFAEEPVSSDMGWTVTVTVTEEMTGGELLDIPAKGKLLGELLESKGLIRDATLFIFQYAFSDYRADVEPGTYTLSTSMTAEEMMEVMAQGEAEDEAEED